MPAGGVPGRDRRGQGAHRRWRHLPAGALPALRAPHVCGAIRGVPRAARGEPLALHGVHAGAWVCIGEVCVLCARACGCAQHYKFTASPCSSCGFLTHLRGCIIVSKHVRPPPPTYTHTLMQTRKCIIVSSSPKIVAQCANTCLRACTHTHTVTHTHTHTHVQARGCIIVSSSPEILCRVDRNNVVTNRPLAGTRRRGSSQEVRGQGSLRLGMHFSLGGARNVAL